MSPRSRGTYATRFPGVPGGGDGASTCDKPLEVLIADLAPSSVDLVRAAVDWLLPEGAGLDELGQIELQEFLWYQLPCKWLAETSVLHEVAWSLAELFTAAGLERYSDLCRSSQTHLLLDAWQDNDREPARKTMNKAVTSSGVQPPDTSLLRWGLVLGEAEHAARRRVSQALEHAIDAGDLVAGERGWKQRAADITDSSLTMRRLDLRGGTLLQAVSRERGERWAAGYPMVRADLLTQILPLLEGEVAIPAGASECLEPLRWLLEHVGQGATLTQAGWLPKAMVLEADDLFGWSGRFGLTVRSETDLPQLATLNELARRARLVTKKGRKLSLSRPGRRALADSGRLWRIVVADIFSAGTFEGEGSALAAAMLLRARGPVPYSAVEAKVGAGLVGRWRTDSEEELEQWSGLDATREFGVLADLFGWIEQGDGGQDRVWTLTSSGRYAALMGLQLQARTPRRHF